MKTPVHEQACKECGGTGQAQHFLGDPGDLPVCRRCGGSGTESTTQH